MMSVTELAPALASILTPLATVTAILIPVLRGNSGARKRLENIEVILQMLILHDEHLPIRERLNAGKRYIDLGGNGATSVYYKKLEEKYQRLVAPKIEEERL